MNRTAYMAELTQRLRRLPLSREDVEDALRFYEEYFDEAGPAQEAAVIAELGSPAYVAAQIALKLSNSPTPLTERAPDKKSGTRPGLKRDASVLRLVILGILASPVALPLALAGLSVVLALTISAAAIVFSFGVGGVACLSAGVAVGISAVAQLPGDFATGVYFIGVALVSVGLGGLLAKLGFWLGRCFVKLATKIGARFFGKGRRPVAMPVSDYAVAGSGIDSNIGNGGRE